MRCCGEGVDLIQYDNVFVYAFLKFVGVFGFLLFYSYIPRRSHMICPPPTMFSIALSISRKGNDYLMCCLPMSVDSSIYGKFHEMTCYVWLKHSPK